MPINRLAESGEGELIVLRRSQVVDYVGEWLPEWSRNRKRVDQLDFWYRGEQEMPKSGKNPSKEYRTLRRISLSPHLRLIVNVVAQGLVVDGYRAADAEQNSAPWEVWQYNGMDARQRRIHRGSLAHSVSYAVSLPGDPLPVIRGVSARRMIAVYGDAAADEWPMFALQVDPSGGGHLARLYDDEAVHFVSVESLGAKPEFIESRVHGSGRVPVVRYCVDLDDDGRTQGEIAPYIPLAERIDQTTFDRLVVQRHASWKVRTIAGMAEPETDDEKRAVERLLEVGDLLVSESPETKFGTLDSTPLDGYIAAKEADIRELAAVSQTPPVDLLGEIANLSAEALEAAKDAAQQKRNEIKLSLGESHEQLLRLAGAQMGDAEAALDYSAQVVWRDVGFSSLSREADALGKLAQMLGVPVQMLWERIPGWTQQDVERARSMAEDGDSLAQLADMLSRGSEPADGVYAGG